MSQNLNYNLQKRLSGVLPNQQSHQSMYSDALAHAEVPYHTFPRLQYCVPIALTFERGAVARLSRHDEAHRLTVKRLGHVDGYYVSPFL